MQQGYRHFNLVQLFRDCIIRSINYKTFRCYPPPMIQEEIKFIQKAKEIAFQELTKEAGKRAVPFPTQFPLILMAPKILYNSYKIYTNSMKKSP